jgi:hypothetical protein
VSNPYGVATSSVAQLKVDSTTYPLIVWQPSSEKVPVGGYVTLSVVAAGTPTLRYQWYRNDVPMSGATNKALVFGAVQLTNAGTYKVLVANDLGTAWTLPATLSVTATNQGGGLVYFSNRGAPGVSNLTPVLDIDGFTRLSGSNYVAQLYAGASLTELRPAGAPSQFYSAGSFSGYFMEKVVTLATVPPGSSVLVQVRAWERNRGTTYEEARALGGKYGKSELLSITTYASGAQPLGLVGLQSFVMQAGLPFFSAGVIQLSHREPGGIVVWSLQGEPNVRYVIEKAAQDFVWEPYLVLTNVTGTVTFTDSASSGANVVLYRSRLLD